ncbi:signal peptide peptidase SppA [Sphingorhabdus arenilitoris]|uniref:Signal peptide peptidase SppA n=1 Tax=Sphingorhabdus arenilitoris TaxID=1490041 RepID=A0ABV8RDQ5_9SPHN
MQFVRGAWKILVALKDGLALLFLILFFAMLFALLKSAPNPANVRDGALLIDIDGFISEQPAAVDPIATLLSGQAPVGEYRQRDIIRALKLAETNDEVKAVVFDLDGFLGAGQVSLSGIGDAIDSVKKSGKPVYSYATAYSDDGYQIAAHASQIWMDPIGGVVVTGPGGTQPYYKGLLDKLGIKANVYRVGTYKSAVEPFIRSDQSTESKEALKAVYDEIWGEWRRDVAAARPAAQLDNLINDPAAAIEAVQGDLAKLAIDNKLVDKLGDRIAFGKFVAEKAGKDPAETLGGYASTPMNALLAANAPDDSGDPIAVVTVAGTIVDGEAGPGTAAGDTVSDLIYSAIENDDVKAIVLRVDSPGGSVLASEKIRRALERAKEKKLPVVVSMANLAASGGYWVSTPADAIFAEPSTITGSIGIFGVIPSGKEALANIGVNADGVKTTPLAGEPDVLNGFSPDFDRFVQSTIEKGYRDFLSRVAKSRSKSMDEVDAIGQGRIWAGGTGRQIGLVDRLGGIDDALAEAAKRAKLADGKWYPSYIEPQADFLSAFLGAETQRSMAGAPQDLFARAAWERQQQWARIQSDLQLLTGVSGAQVNCLECGALAGTPVLAPTAKADSGWLSFFAKLAG